MNKIRVFMAFIVAAFLVCSCDRDALNMGSSDKEGTLSLQLEANSEVRNLGTRTDEAAEFPVGDFSLSIFRGDDLIRTWAKFSDFQEGTVFPYGSYTTEASYGSLNDEGWDKPFISGSQAFSIASQGVTNGTISCTLQNAKVAGGYTDAFKDYFQEYSTNVITSLGGTINFVSDETRAAYVKPGTINFNVIAKRPGATNSQTIPLSPIVVAAKSQYNMTLDVDAGAAQLVVSFNDEVDVEPIVIDISDIAVNKAPYFNISGFASGVEQSVVEGRKTEKPLQVLLTAQSGIKSCILTTNAKSLIDKGWPATVDLMNVSAQNRELFNVYGFKPRGFDANSEGVAHIDFSDLVSNLEFVSDNDVSTFTLTATDLLDKTADADVVLAIKVTDNGFAFTFSDPIPYGAYSASAFLTIDGDINAVTYQWFAMGAWQNIVPASIVDGETASTYHVNFAFPLSLTNTTAGLQMRAMFKQRTLTATCAISEPAITLSAPSEGSVWATSATFQVAQASSTRALNMELLSIEYKDGENWLKPVQTQDGNLLTVSGLTAGTNYTFRAMVKDDAGRTGYSDILNVATEAATQVPNADMNGWNVEATKKLAKGMWDGTSPITYDAYIPNSGSWATTNAKTFNHSESGNMNYAINAYPSVINENRGGNNYAAVIRSIGWNNGSGNGYGGLTTNTCKQRSAGKIFLGSYSFDVNSQTDSYNYGIAFVSRPKSISFEYKYDSYNNDNFKVWAVVENRNDGSVKQLAYGEITAGNAAGSYTNATVALNYNSEYTNLKATHFYIVFSSSNKCSDLHSEETNLMETPTRMVKIIDSSYWGGSVLCVDNIQLIY